MSALIITLYCVNHLPLSSLKKEYTLKRISSQELFHLFSTFIRCSCPFQVFKSQSLIFYADKDNLKIPLACFVTANRVPPNSAVHKTLELRVLHKGQFSSSSQLLFLVRSVCCCLTVKQSAIDEYMSHQQPSQMH